MDAIHHTTPILFYAFEYFTDSYLRWQDVVVIVTVSLLLSFLATIYPALRAAKVQPAEALRYE